MQATTPYHTALYATICHIMRQFGCVMLPLMGKRPADVLYSWKDFQTTPPTTEQLAGWFNRPDNTITSYGILMGRISNGLIGLDFDDPTTYETFKQHFPHIAATYTVKTRRGYHVYLRASWQVKSQKFTGGDIQGEGRYLVGPGSTIKEGQVTTHYRTLCELPPYVITQEEWTSILDTLIPETQRHTTETQNAIKDTYSTKHYTQLASEVGRNNALYHIARQMHAAGQPISDTIAELGKRHATTPPTGQHPPETYRQRYTEAIATIRSAYRNKRHQVTNHNKTALNPDAIPNGLREHLMHEYNTTVIGRTLEMLYKEGYTPGNTLTMTTAQKTGKNWGIGEKGIRRTLETLCEKVPYIVTNHPVGEGDNATVNENITKGRRPKHLYIMPSIEDLCTRFGIIPQASDPLTQEDLSSAANYRAALHREFVKRTTPEAPCAWHAARLNVSTRTIRRYNQRLGIISTPVYGYVPITSQNIDNPAFYGTDRTFTPGQWLQNESGTRFPAVKGIALQRRKKGETLVTCRQLASRYTLPDEDTDLSSEYVIWRRLDLPRGGYDWHGNAHDFPPIDPKPMSFVIEPPTVVQKSLFDAPLATYSPEKQLADPQRGPPDTYPYAPASMTTDSPLTQVKGIGPARALCLHNAGIDTLEELVETSAEDLLAIGWPGGYVTLGTTARWIEQAEILLGYRKPDLVAQQLEEQYRVHRRHIKRYKTAVEKYRVYVKQVLAWEHHLFGTAREWKRQPHFWWVKQCDTNDPDALLRKERLHFIEIVETFLTAYQARVETFTAMPESDLRRYELGDLKEWRKIERQTKRQLKKWQALHAEATS